MDTAILALSIVLWILLAAGMVTENLASLKRKREQELGATPLRDALKDIVLASDFVYAVPPEPMMLAYDRAVEVLRQTKPNTVSQVPATSPTKGGQRC